MDFLKDVLNGMWLGFVLLVCGAAIVSPLVISIYMAEKSGSWFWIIGGVVYYLALIGVVSAAINRCSQ